MFPQSMNHSSHMNILYSIGGDVTQAPFITGHGYYCGIPQSPKLAVSYSCYNVLVDFVGQEFEQGIAWMACLCTRCLEP